MKWDETSEQLCSVARATSIFGDRWTMLIIRQFFMGMSKFSDIQKTLGITKHRLSDRLTRLTEESIISKRLYDEKYNRYEYQLTEKGLDLLPVFITIGQWGDKWAADSDGAPMEYVHKDCGRPAKPALCCTACGDSLNISNISVRMGPGLQKKLEDGTLNDMDRRLYENFIGAAKE